MGWEISTKIIRQLLEYTDMHLPVLPFQDIAIHFKADAIWLSDMQWLDAFAKLKFWLRLPHQIRKIIEGLCGRCNTRPFRKPRSVKTWRFGSRCCEFGLAGGRSYIRRREIWPSLETEKVTGLVNTPMCKISPLFTSTIGMKSYN